MSDRYHETLLRLSRSCHGDDPRLRACRNGKRKSIVTKAMACNGHSMRYALTALVLAGVATLGGCSEGVLDPKGPIASAEQLLLINSTAIMLVVVVPVVAATLAFAWWYRASNPRASRQAAEAYEGRIEFVIWSIPALIVILLSGVIWIGSHQLDPRTAIAAKAQPLRVEVVALDWKWLFIYPDQGIAAVNELVMPAGTPVAFRLTSATVMNSFFIPQLGSQIYAMGGMTTHLHLLADAPGEYPGFSAMYSGDGFSDMRFVAKAVSAADFDAEQSRAARDLSLGGTQPVRAHHRSDRFWHQ
jgi:cytochrome o ubiquinol oxidase subunit II